MPNKWINALKIFNKNKCEWCVPKKGTKEYEQVKKNMNNNEKLWNSCKEGVIKGCVTGGITGGMAGAISGGALFGIANPLLLYINGNL